MAINQFAKISPIIDSNGYLYNLNQDGTVMMSDGEPVVSTTNRLKANEIGIIYKEDILATMYNGNLVRLGVTVYDDSVIEDLLKENDGSLNGKLIVLKKADNVYYLGIINGNTVTHPIFNTTHAAYFTVDDSKNSYSDSYIGYIPYNILRVTLKINDNILNTDGTAFTGDIVFKTRPTSSESKEICRVEYRDIIYNKGTSNEFTHELLECQNIFDNFTGEIIVQLEDINGTVIDTLNKEIKICIEYIIDNIILGGE